MVFSMLTACGQSYSVGMSASTPSSEPTEFAEPISEFELEESMDSSSKLIPDLGAFLLRDEMFSKDHYAYGLPYGREVSFQYIPLQAYETVRGEVLSLMQESCYQLELVESRENEFYSLTAVDYYYNYTGTAGEITQITDRYEEKYTFHVMLRFLPDPEEGYFHIFYFYCDALELTEPDIHTVRNTAIGSDGDILTEIPDGVSDNDDDFWEKCSSCHGSGDCTRCDGTGEVQKFQAGLGWVDQDCTSCSGGNCRWCGGTGKD